MTRFLRRSSETTSPGAFATRVPWIVFPSLVFAEYLNVGMELSDVNIHHNIVDGTGNDGRVTPEDVRRAVGGQIEVIGEEIPVSPVRRAVVDRLTEVAICHDRQDGTEDLFLHDPHVVPDVENQRWRERVGAGLRALG